MAALNVTKNISQWYVMAMYVKYEEAEVDRLVVILKKNDGGGGPCGIQ